MKETKKIESVTVVVDQVAAKAATPTAKVTKEQPKEQTQTAEKLQEEIVKKQKELQMKLQELETKQKLNNNRSKFLETLDNLGEFKDKLDEMDSFETNIFRVKFCSVESGYRDNDLFSVSNVSVLLDLIDFMHKRIKIKVAEIEQQLLK